MIILLYVERFRTAYNMKDLETINDDQTCCSAEREDRDRYGIENHPVGRLGADWNEYYRI